MMGDLRKVSEQAANILWRPKSDDGWSSDSDIDRARMLPIFRNARRSERPPWVVRRSREIAMSLGLGSYQQRRK